MKKVKFYNKIVDKGGLKKLIAWAFSNYGSAKCAQMCDDLKALGFRYATQAAVSISVDDLQIPPTKKGMLQKAELEVETAEARYSRGEITEVERFQKVIDTWNSTSEALKNEVVRNFKETNPLNSVYMMAFSGARGNMSQVRQLVGMRGLMADPQGEIIDQPIKTNFREGLTVTEYIISSYGARKGLVDTALRTADSGYLTRRLVDVSQDVIVRENDCGTQRYVQVTPMKDGDRVLIPLKDRLLGRVLAEDVVDPETEVFVGRKNQPIDADLAIKIGKAVETVKVRSPLTCEAARSVCRYCYGWSLAHGKMVNLGEAVGIIAAQSIGEPGTQLTMRTFHTGGVFTGEVARQVKATIDGKIKFDKKLAVRKIRTRHGDEREQVEVGGNLLLSNETENIKISISTGSILYVKDDMEVKAGQLLAEIIPAKLQKSTEKATKDVASDLAGEVVFADLVPEEKKDKQGNTTKLATRSGLLWVLSGQVYNLPPGAEPVVKNGDQLSEGIVLAETKLVTNSGGVVRLIPDSREIEIITASVLLDRAQVCLESTGGREQYVIYAQSGERFLLKAAPGTKVQNNQVVAEYSDDRYLTQTGGVIKYAGVEVTKGNRKQGYEISQGGTLLWIPEETHEVNKDISLLLVEDGQYIEAGTEIVKDIFSQEAGIVEVIQKNDILREITIKPGEIYYDLDPDSAANISDGNLIQPGTEVLPGVIVEDLKQALFVDTPEGLALLLQPVEQYTVSLEVAAPSQDSLNSDFGDDHHIRLRSTLRLFFKDGERVKSVDSVQLLSTQLVLEIDSEKGSSADIELVYPEGEDELPRLQMVIIESLVLRRDLETDPHIKTKLLVETEQEIPEGAVVARTEILCRETGEIRGIREGLEAIRRILLVRETDLFTIECQNPQVKPGDLIVAEAEIAEGIKTPESGQVVSVEEDRVVMRKARPYRVSAGAILHIDDGDLVQRGDSLVLLVFERSKTGDIIQGLPRIEELLEARKPKEAAILVRRPGICQVNYAEDDSVEVKVNETEGVVSDYPIIIGKSVLLSDGQQVETGDAITDGPANPHEILEIFFDLHVDNKGVYEAALIALEKAQKFLVDQVQSVYQSQGIDISDKHIEVIVRQMTSKVRIDDGGDTTMLPGELVELRQVEQVNEAMAITGGAPARYTPVLLGITKASLNTDSFISAASFQETTRVLTEAAIEGKSDWLRGLKENVIIGRLIPAGTGFNTFESESSLVEEESFNPEMNGVNNISPEMVRRKKLKGDISSSFGLDKNNSDEEILDDQTAAAFLNENQDLSESDSE